MTQRAGVAVHGLADVLCGQERRRGDGTGRGAARLSFQPRPPPCASCREHSDSTFSGGLSPPPTRDLVCFPLSWSRASSPEGQGFVLTASWSVMRNRLCIGRTY